MKKVLSLVLSICMLFSICTGLTFTAQAAEPEPAEVKNLYELDGIKYINAGDGSFSTNQTAYYRAMLGNALNSHGGYFSDASVSGYWTRLGLNAASNNNKTESNISNGIYKFFGNIEENQYIRSLARNDTGKDQVENVKLDFGGLGLGNNLSVKAYRETLKSAATADAMARAVGQNAAGLSHGLVGSKVNVKAAPEFGGPVFYTTIGLISDELKNYSKLSGYDFHSVVVAYSDFSVTPIIPESNDEAPYVYVTATDGTSTVSDVKSVSDVKNISGEKVTASQSVSESTSSSISSSISGSSSYTIGTSMKIGLKMGAKAELMGSGGSVEMSEELTASASESVSKGWSQSESVTSSNSKSSSVSVTLPAYTTVLMSQKRTKQELKTYFNCPVALNYKATIYYVYGKSSSTTDIYFREITSFGDGNSAQEDLAERYGDYESAGMADRDGIDWYWMKLSDYDPVVTLTKIVPFDSTSAAFTEKVDSVKTQVENILPIYPIDKIKPENADSVLTSQQWLYQINMNEGDYDYTGHLGLKALNKMGAEFVTFYKDNGRFIITDEDGNEDTSGKVVELVKDRSSGQTKYIAKGPGTAYLKYIIDEDVYQTASMAATAPNTYITNDDITTAVIQINVSHVHKLKKVKATEPTCEETGNTAYWVCSEGDNACGKYFSDKECKNEIDLDETVIKATGHIWGEWIVTKESTETEKGEETRTCTVCGKTQTRETSLGSHVHNMVKTAAKDATCENDGNIRYWKCEGCGNYYTDKYGENEVEPEDVIIKATGHNWDSGKVTKVPTCVEPGVSTLTCQACGKVVNEELPATGSHIYKAELTAAPTCVDKGYYTYTCIDCGASYKEEMPELGHDLKAEWNKNKTYHWHACMRCKEKLDKAEHTYGKSGDTRFTCTICGYVNKTKKKEAKAADKAASEKASASIVAGLKGTTDGKTVNVKWGKVKGADRYAIYATYCGYDNFIRLRTVKGTSYNVMAPDGNKLDPNKDLKVYIVAEKKVDGEYTELCDSPIIHIAGKKSKNTNVKKINVKKNNFTLKVNKTAKIKPSLVLENKNKKLIAHVAKYRYVSSNKAVATVDKNGKIKAVGKGTAIIYVYGANGVAKAVKVTVK